VVVVVVVVMKVTSSLSMHLFVCDVGTNIGNADYVNKIQLPFSLETEVLVVNTVDLTDPSRFDDVTENYQIGGDSEQMTTQESARCAFTLNLLPVDAAHPEDPMKTYGPHDIKNYKFLLDASRGCVV